MPPTLSLHVTPPKPGRYALWIQFIGGTAVRTVPFVLAIAWDLLTLASLWFLVRPESAAWFAEGRTADPADL